MRVPFSAILATFLAAPCIAQDAIPVTRLAPDVYFLEMPSSPKFIGSNVGWIVFDDYVLVIDAGFAPGARVALEEIRRVTDKPIRFVLDTHHHPDHAFGNGIFVAEGAAIVCHEACQKREREVSTAAFDESNADSGEKIAWKTGTLTFRDRMVLDDGTHRVEIIHLGHAHTAGDAIAWLPKEKIAFTGDACVNGAFNYMGDADTESWVRVLDRIHDLGPETIAPGHGKTGPANVLAMQTRWLVDLRAAVTDGLGNGLDLDGITRGLDMPWYAEWTGKPAASRAENAKHVYGELSGVLPPTGFLTELGITSSGPAPRDTAGWVPPKKILVPANLPAHLLTPVAPGVELVRVSNAADAISKASDADAAIGFCSNDLLNRGTNLRWVQVGSAGVERYVGHEAIADGRVTLTNAQRLHGPPIAEHVFAMLFALTRGLNVTIPLQAQRIWNAGAIRGEGSAIELKGRTLLVAGLGGIGSEVARIGHGLGMRVIATRRNPSVPPEGVEKVGGAGDLRAYAAESDVVVNCMPLTSETERLFDAAFFEATKQGAYFVNIGPGRSVVTADLVAALESGKLRGAALDVTDPEPLPGDSKLWTLPNVVITPHVSAESDRSDDRVLKLFRENLRRFVAGEALLNVVDPKSGY